MNQISDGSARWLEARGISAETAVRMGIRTEEHNGDNVLAFPIIHNGQEINTKYRSQDKRFWQREGGEQIFWNHDVLLEHPKWLVITEGEIDALSAIEAGFPHTVSVPGGAPNTVSEEPIDDSCGKFAFIQKSWSLLKGVEKFILAVDGDPPGKCLAEELVRRLSPQRCWFVTYPEGTKDLNDVLKLSGVEGVQKVLGAAKPYPVKGLYQYSDLPEEPPIEPVSTGMDGLDRYFKPFAGAFIVEVGFPGAGKTTFNSRLVTNLAELHGWHTTIATLENGPRYFANMIIHGHSGIEPEKLSGQRKVEVEAWVQSHFTFIAQQPTDDTDDIDLDFLIDRAEAAVIRHGSRCLLIDPWNELEHKRRNGENETEYTSRAIRRLRRFGSRMGVCVICVTHPTKIHDNREPTLYDISGSAHWANKCDVGLILSRDPNSNTMKILVRKPRYKKAFRHGDVSLYFDSERFQYTTDPTMI